MTQAPPSIPGPPRDELRSTVFVSYAHEDAGFAGQLIADLDAAGHACWIDTSNLKGGDEWTISIPKGISASYAFLVIVTQHALDSRWVREEILWARTKEKPIIPVICENVMSDERFFLLNSYQGITLFDAAYADKLPKLLQALPAPSAPHLEADPARRAELAYLDRLRFEELINTEKYTPLGGITGWDNRKGVRVVDGLPQIDWVEIPAGEFQYGDESEDNNKPQKLMLPTFHISRYPMTYAQFQSFLDDSEGFANPQWFDGLAASDDERAMSEQYFKFANHPRETVTWYQTMAFCRWLSWRLGGGYDLKKVTEWAVRLPTEFEWEKAARGTDGRLYPYTGESDAAKGNTDDTGIGQTSAVGIFPNGASPYGVEEMSGNVWEWCLSNYDKPALDARKENLRADKTRVLRGGSWANAPARARTVYRYGNFPGSRFSSIGFRVVCVLRPPS